MEVDVPVEREHEGGLGVVSGRRETLDAPRGNGLSLVLPTAARRSDGCLDRHVYERERAMCEQTLKSRYNKMTLVLRSC